MECDEPSAQGVVDAVRADATCIRAKIQAGIDAEWPETDVMGKIGGLQEKLYSILEDIWNMMGSLFEMHPDHFEACPFAGKKKKKGPPPGAVNGA